MMVATGIGCSGSECRNLTAYLWVYDHYGGMGGRTMIAKEDSGRGATNGKKRHRSTILRLMIIHNCCRSD